MSVMIRCQNKGCCGFVPRESAARQLFAKEPGERRAENPSGAQEIAPGREAESIVIVGGKNDLHGSKSRESIRQDAMQMAERIGAAIGFLPGDLPSEPEIDAVRRSAIIVPTGNLGAALYAVQEAGIRFTVVGEYRTAQTMTAEDRERLVVEMCDAAAQWSMDNAGSLIANTEDNLRRASRGAMSAALAVIERKGA